MPKESMRTQVREYVGLRNSWGDTHPTDLSEDMVDADPQLCNDILAEDIERLTAMLEVAQDAVKHVRYHKLAVRQGEGFAAKVEANWRVHAVENPPISDALWEFMSDSISTAGYESERWERLEWVKPGTPAWVTDIAKAAIGKCWSPFCFMRCSPNESRDIMLQHGIWSHGQDLYVVGDESDLPFYSQLADNVWDRVRSSFPMPI